MTHRLRRGLGLIATAAVLATASAAASAGANLLVNGDFDNTNGTWVQNTGLGGDDLQSGGTLPPGWGAVPGLANDIWIEAANNYGLTASPGNGSGYFLDLTGQANSLPFGGIEQTVATVPQAWYQLTWDWGFSSLYNGVSSAESEIVGEAIGSTTQGYGLGSSPGTATDGWESISWGFQADATSTIIEFLAPSDFAQSQYAGLDNVSLTLVSLPPVSPAPEPAGMAMLLAGLGLMGVVARRRHGSPARP